MRASTLWAIAAILTTAACTAEPTGELATLIPSHDGKNPVIVGIERVGDGPYRAGETERFRAVTSGDVVDYAWWASGGALDPRGAEVLWTLPGAADARLELTVTDAAGVETTSQFSFATTLAGDIDPSDDLTGSFCDLAFGTTSAPHVAYSNDTHAALWYATNAGGWAAELVDGPGFDTGGLVRDAVSIAVDSSNRPHIAYLASLGGVRQVRYAHKTGGTWLIERVDTTLPYFSVSPQAVAIALDPANGQRPTIVYTTSPASNLESVVVAYRLGPDSWFNELGPESPDEHEFGGGLVFDSTGVAHYTARVDYGGDGVIAGTWNPLAANHFTETPIPGMDSSEGSRVTLDASEQPILIHRNGVEHRVGAAFVHSEIEGGGVVRFDIAFDGVRPHVVLRHGSSLELVTTDSRGYWQYTDVGPADSSAIGIAIDNSGAPHICYRQSGNISYL